MKDLSDEELAARCARGDRRAMDVLVSRYHSRLLDFAFRRLGHRETAADIAQTTFVRVFESVGKYRPRASFRTWMYTIALNLIRDEFRKQRARRESLSCDVEADVVGNRPEDTTDSAPEPAAISQAESDELWQAVRELPENHASAILLRFREGLQYAEIAEIMSAPAGTVRSWVHHALKALRGTLESTSCRS